MSILTILGRQPGPLERSSWRSTTTFVRMTFARPALAKKELPLHRPPRAGKRSPVIYSVLGSCQRLDINPAEYLQDLFERLPKAEVGF